MTYSSSTRDITHFVAGVDYTKLRWPKLALIQSTAKELSLTKDNLNMEWYVGKYRRARCNVRDEQALNAQSAHRAMQGKHSQGMLGG